jgi:putative phosphoribosyl transferase
VTAMSMRPFPARPPFRNRADAGETLAHALGERLAGISVTVVGVARGGVPAACIVAERLGAPLGVAVTSKVEIPGLPESSLAALAEGRRAPIADTGAQRIGVPRHVVQRLATRERVHLDLRAHMYRVAQSPPVIRGRTIVLVDDGVITGSTLRAAARAIRAQGAERIIAAVPAASRRGEAKASAEVDEFIALVTFDSIDTLAAIYENHDTVSDHDVLSLLRRTNGGRSFPATSSKIVRDVSDRISGAWLNDAVSNRERPVEIPVHDGRLSAKLGSPWAHRTDDTHAAHPRGLVIFARSSAGGRDRYSDRYFAGRCRLSGYTTLRVDLLANGEGRHPGDDVSMRVDLGLLSDRLASVCEWAARNDVRGHRPPILAGTDIGGAVALALAARARMSVGGVIALGARLDLVRHLLDYVTSPVLLVAGEKDVVALERSSRAVLALRGKGTLARVPRAGPAFAESGALGRAGEHMAKWLDRQGRIVS